MRARAFEALYRILDRGGEPDDILRATVSVLAEEPEITWAGIAFLEDGSLTLGPAAGTPAEARRIRTPILFDEADVGELWVDGVADQASLDRVASLVSAHVLIGWDTRGETWDP
jgi:hypothetical protein